MKNLHILYTLDSWYPDVCGPNIVIDNYASILTRQGHDCRLMVPSYGKKADGADKAYGFPVDKIKSMPVFGYRNVLPRLDAKARAVQKQPLDIIHCHSPFGLCDYCEKWAAKAGVPVILTFHTKFRDEFMRVTRSKLLTGFMMKRIMRAINSADHLLTVSNGAADTLREYGYKGEITVIRNGTDMLAPVGNEAQEKVERDYALKGKPNVFLFVGRIVSVKNLELVFEALAILKQRRYEFTFIVVGDGPHLSVLKRLAADMDIADRIVFTGMIADREYLKGFYMRADLFLFPSYFDTASLVPLEAAAFGLPTLLIKDSPTAEVIEDGVSGYAEPDDAEAWATRMASIIAASGGNNRVRESCRDSVYRSWQDVTTEILNYYGEVLDGKK